jgi:hypothetical protein
MRIGANAAVAILLFGAVFVTHSICPISQSGDSFWTVPLMLSLLSEGNANLDEFPDLLREKHYNGLECVTAEYRVIGPDGVRGCPAGSHYYYWYPIGTPVVALPLMIAMDATLRVVGPTIDRVMGDRLRPVARVFVRRNYLASHLLVEVVLGSAIVALATALLFLTARFYLRVAGSIVLALLFAFGTSAWSTASRALWQQGPLMLTITAALYLLALAMRRPALLPWAAAPLTLGYFIRPTAGIVLGLVGAYVFWHHRRQFTKWFLAAAVTAAPFLAYNLFIYHRPVQSYFTPPWFLPPTPPNLGPILNAFAGNAVSPSRGLFIFSPFLLFSIAGVWLAVGRNWMTPLAYYLAAALALHWILLSDYMYWTAGYSYGPRLFSDVLPLFLFFLIPAFLWLRLDEPRRLLSITFYVCVLVSVFIHYRGATTWAPYEWNAHPSEVTIERAWDWRDPQFLRGIFDRIQK